MSDSSVALSVVIVSLVLYPIELYMIKYVNNKGSYKYLPLLTTFKNKF